MINKDLNRNAKNKKDSKVALTILFIFFAIIFCVNCFYIYISQKTWRGVYSENSYQKGLKYNETLEYVKLQKQLGWKFIAQYKNIQKNFGEINVCLIDRGGKYLTNAKIILKLTRPIQEGEDFQQHLIAKNKCYFAKISFPEKGQWIFEIQAFLDDKVFQEVYRYVVQ